MRKDLHIIYRESVALPPKQAISVRRTHSGNGKPACAKPVFADRSIQFLQCLFLMLRRRKNGVSMAISHASLRQNHSPSSSNPSFTANALGLERHTGVKILLNILTRVIMCCRQKAGRNPPTGRKSAACNEQDSSKQAVSMPHCRNPCHAPWPRLVGRPINLAFTHPTARGVNPARGASTVHRVCTRRARLVHRQHPYFLDLNVLIRAHRPKRRTHRCARGTLRSARSTTSM